MTVDTIFSILLGLQFKHFVFDGPLQSHAMVLAKGHYGRKLGLLHSALHGLGTLLVLVISPLAWPTIFVLSVADSVVHYHIDYSKERLSRAQGWTTENKYFWWALSLDQALHQLTYLAMVFALVRNIL